MDTATPPAPPGMAPRWSLTAPDRLRAAHPHLPEELDVLRQDLKARWVWILGRDGLHLASSGEPAQEQLEQASAVMHGLWGGCTEAGRVAQRGDPELLMLRSSQECLLVVEVNATAMLAALLPERSPSPYAAYTMAQFAAQHTDVRATHERPAVRAGGLR